MKTIIATIVLICQLFAYESTKTCWNETRGEYTNFLWTDDSDANYNAIDNEITKLFVYSVVNAKSWVCKDYYSAEEIDEILENEKYYSSN